MQQKQHPIYLSTIQLAELKKNRMNVSDMTKFNQKSILMHSYNPVLLDQQFMKTLKELPKNELTY